MLYQAEQCTGKEAYSTLWGNITFEEFYQYTHKLLAHKLRQSGLEEQDIEDCLQAAYLKVWQKLEANPHVYEGKSISYIVQSLYFHSKAQRFSQQRYNHKIAYNSEMIQDSHLTPQRIDHWIDLQTAISGVIELVKDTPFALFALYTLITSVKVNDVQQILACSIRTLTKYRKTVRTLLIQHLPNYGHTDKQSLHLDFVSVPIAQALLDL